MNLNAPDRETLRQYLLGRLDGNNEMEDQISKAILVDEDLSELVESIEDEIIEDYLEGTLDRSDSKSVNEYFLLPPERQQKLRFFRLLQEHFATRSQTPSGVQDDISPARTKNEPNRGMRASARWTWGRAWIYCQVVALLIIGGVTAQYVLRIHKSQALLEADLAHERARAASLATGLAQLQEPAALLTLANERGRSLGEEFSEITRSTERLHVTIAVIGHPKAASYVVKLSSYQSSEPVWTARLFPIEDKFGDVQLRFDLPAHSLQAGHYSLVVSPQASGSGQYHYDFEVKVRE